MSRHLALALVLSALLAASAVAQGPPAIVVEPAPQPPAIAAPNWLKRPNGADYERFYPFWARQFEVEGSVSLDCLVGAYGQLDCAVTSEEPAGWGFGAAALRISREFRMRPQTQDGRPTAGGRYRLRIPFRFSD